MRDDGDVLLGARAQPAAEPACACADGGVGGGVDPGFGRPIGRERGEVEPGVLGVCGEVFAGLGTGRTECQCQRRRPESMINVRRMNTGVSGAVSNETRHGWEDTEQRGWLERGRTEPVSQGRSLASCSCGNTMIGLPSASSRFLSAA